jgi:predicted amidohydrolase/GNAT superfamily N-acetyltransferase
MAPLSISTAGDTKPAGDTNEEVTVEDPEYHASSLPRQVDSPIPEHHLKLRNLVREDYEDIQRLMDLVYADFGGAWPRDKFYSQIATFPEGQICIEDNGRVIAAAFAVIVDYDKFGDQHTYDQITGNAYLTTHDPDGDVLYGVDIFVDPQFRGMRLGRRLYQARKALCRHLNLRAIVAGGRIPGYSAHAEQLSPPEYIEKVQQGELYDPILSFQLSNEFQVRRVLRNYLPEDSASHGYATLLEWTNIYYEPKPQPGFNQRRDRVRIGVLQWQMRWINSVEELIQQMEFFIDALSDYQSDFALFPEFFSAPLMGFGPRESPLSGIRHLASYTEHLRDEISRLAMSYNINIIAGSMPLYEEGVLYNVAYLCRRDGTIDAQYKIHPTPYEQRAWVMRSGDQLRVFETDAGKIGILICYDVEFPELARLLADQQMQILFVPFWTDTKNGYLRVKRCAQARAIENECYVAIAGSVGNLPQVDNLDIQYAESAVFSPSDFAFPHDAIMAESTPNTEMALIVDLDLTKLETLRYEGSVQNYRDRKRHLYRIEWLGRR